MINVISDVVSVLNDNNRIIIPFTFIGKLYNELNLQAILINEDTEETQIHTDCLFVNVEGVEKSTNKITEENKNGVFSVQINLPSLEYKVYIRAYDKDTSFISPIITPVGEKECVITTKPKDVNFRPKKISVVDNINCIVNNSKVDLSTAHFDINVFVTNNATSTNVIWEDMTESYLASSEYEINNDAKDFDKPYSVSVKYQLTKLETNSTVEITDIQLIIV